VPHTQIWRSTECVTREFKEDPDVSTNRILIIVTNVGEYHKVGYRTGLWLGELTRRFMGLLQNTKKISEINVADYDAIYFTGGHGVMFDFHGEELGALTARFYESGRIVSAVCHGPCGLLNVTLSTGEPLVKGKNVTGFAWPEEELAGREQTVPYSLQEELKKLGANYSVADKPFETHVVEDGRLITGQNPGSARTVAEAVVNHLKAQ
jgi:putative intracellular protease/amidase